MGHVRKVETEDGTYIVYVGGQAVRCSLTSAEADEVMASLAYLAPAVEY